MPKPRLNKRESTYIQFKNYLSELGNKENLKLIEAMNRLNQQIEEKKQLEAQEFDEQKKKELLEAYKNAMLYLTQIHDKHIYNYNPEDNLLLNVRHVRRIMAKDLNTLNKSINDKKTESFSDMLDNSRSKKIVLNKKLADLESNAGNQSTRFKLEIDTDDNKKKAGYFTENKAAVMTTGEEREYVTNCLIKISEKYDLDLESLETGGFYECVSAIAGAGSKIRDMFDEVPNLHTNIATGFKSSKEKMVKTCRENGYKGIASYINSIDDPQVYRAFCEFTYDMTHPLIAKNIVNTVGITGVSNFNKRNSAMSRVAELIGCSNVLAHSESVHVQVQTEDGPKVIKGTFMEEAKGSDLHKIDEKDPMYRANIHNLEESPGLTKKIADLQILDYLCGNPDRHRGNMIYTIKKGKLVDIKGIDNDTCFGAADHTKYMAGVKLENLQVISKDTAKKVLALDEETFKYMLFEYELEQPEVDNAVNRLRTLKQKILKDEKEYEYAVEGKLIDGKLKICDDEELDYLSIPYQLGMKKNEKGKFEIDKKNLFGVLTENFIPGAAFESVEGNYVSELYKNAATMLTDYQCNLEEDVETLKLKTTSESYKTMMQAANQLNDLLKSDIKCANVNTLVDNNNNEIGKSCELSPDFMKIKPLTEIAMLNCREFIEYVNGKNFAHKQDVLDNCNEFFKHLEDISNGCELLDRNIKDVNRILKDKNNVIRETRFISNNSLRTYKDGKMLEIERAQLRNNANNVLEPLVEKQADMDYEISEISKELKALSATGEENKNSEKIKKLSAKKENLKLDHLKLKLELMAAGGIREMLTDPDNPDTTPFETGLAAGIIRYKLELMKIKKPDSKTRQELNALSGVNVDTNDIDKSIGELLGNNKFKQFAAKFNENSFKPQDIKDIATGKFKNLFRNFAKAYDAPEVAVIGPKRVMK